MIVEHTERISKQSHEMLEAYIQLVRVPAEKNKSANCREYNHMKLSKVCCIDIHDWAI